MTSVNVTTTNNTISVTENGSSVVVQNPATTTTVTATTVGPRGPRGLAGSNFSLEQSAKVDKSIVYYDSSSGEYRADDTWTIQSIVLGGNF